MRVSALGEFGLIDRLAHQVAIRPVAIGERVVLGIGDDAAVWRSRGPLTLATTDSLVEGIHFRQKTATPQELGWKALAINLSDIAALGGIPEFALVTLALPQDTEVAWVEGLYEGLLACCQEYGVAVVGGDIVAAPLIVITVALTGRGSGARRLLRRNAARAGELIAVTGHLGTSAGGLRMLQEELTLPAADAAELRQAHLRPQPRLGEAQALVTAEVKAAIDLSDGLVADLAKLAYQSQVAAHIWSWRLPIHPALARSFGPEALRLALEGGEDYELLFTTTQEAFVELSIELATPLTVIGEVMAGPPGQVVVLDEAGQPLAMGRGGWDHLAPSDTAPPGP